MGFATEQASGSKAGGFVSGPIGQCDICRNRHELGGFDGRMICEECFKCMQAGLEKKRAAIQGDAPPPPCQAPQVAIQTWNAVEGDEKARYLDIIRGASPQIVSEVIDNLVQERVLEHDFHKIIQNERWFSIVDLRRIALRVNPEFDSPPPATREEVTVKPKGKKKCQTRRQTRMHQPPLLQPIPQEEPLLQHQPL